MNFELAGWIWVGVFALLVLVTYLVMLNEKALIEEYSESDLYFVVGLSWLIVLVVGAVIGASLLL